MVQLSSLILCVSLLSGLASAAPLRVRHHNNKTAAATTGTLAATSGTVAANTAGSVAATGTFTVLDYADFQISDGVAGNAAAEANAVFVDPFNGVDLSTVSQDTIENVETMREAAENAEIDDFNPAIAAATGDAAAALQVGKIKNKVLKLTGLAQVVTMKIAVATAAGDDITALQTQLASIQALQTTNIGLDVASAGAVSQGVV